jgi:hypothetical protein
MAKIQLGNLNKNNANPVMVKEKITPSGEPITKIYQRKDINSIEKLKDKLATKMKYSIEDFISKYELFSGLSKQMGFTRIEKLNIRGFDDAIEVLQTVKYGARINSIDSDKEKYFNKILEANSIRTDYGIHHSVEKDKPGDIISDLNNLVAINPKELPGISENLKKIKTAFENTTPLTREECFQIRSLLMEIDNSLTEYFDRKTEENKNEALSQGKSVAQDPEFKAKQGNVYQLRSKFGSQINKLKREIFEVSFDYGNIKNATAKKIWESIQAHPNRDKKNTYKDIKALTKDIDCLFSTSPWVSKGRKQQAADKLSKACSQVPDTEMISFVYSKVQVSKTPPKYKVEY